ncbi:serine-tRNA ligase [Blastocystis sp. subtype 4]|uniref:serine-tRNA ligase n=1 Tax=Blastocystis sp. subtype 4 TaxID=944170 RepID=UPI0007116BD6|nr:serine-tRNA ligase [Blastocystis sp. subtype 4]KNB45123.1 serine-tRNA ligase [Blastocystis sp. subtype 4]|eukprot:XP_014528581.1 serine-tRNA ligase [Blastocystis sp. subtype 4]
MPIDINLLRAFKGGVPELVRLSQAKRFADVGLVDRVIALDDKWRKLVGTLDNYNKEKHIVSKEVIGKKRKQGLGTSEELKEISRLKEEITNTQTLIEKARIERDQSLNRIGNIISETTPIAKDESENVEVTRWGVPREMTRDMYCHHELLWKIDGYEPERGVRVAGHRGYFLKGAAVLLNQAIIMYAMHWNSQRGFTMLQTPYFMNRDVMAGVAQLEDFDEELYHVEGEEGDEKYLIATSEQPICGYHMGEWLDEKELPLKYTGFSTNFRKEAGAHGKDTWGIFRVHQFDKVEQFVICKPEDSWEMHEYMIKNSREFYESLNLPYRVVNIVSGALNNAAAKKYDLEGWFPGYNAYRELVSCSNCTDYQSRAMEIRCGSTKKANEDKRYVHMLNSTLCALTRTLCCILENYQTEDGIQIPEKLLPYMNGITFLPFTRDLPSDMMKAREERLKQMN